MVWGQRRWIRAEGCFAVSLCFIQTICASAFFSICWKCHMERSLCISTCRWNKLGVGNHSKANGFLAKKPSQKVHLSLGGHLCCWLIIMSCGIIKRDIGVGLFVKRKKYYVLRNNAIYKSRKAWRQIEQAGKWCGVSLVDRKCWWATVITSFPCSGEKSPELCPGHQNQLDFRGLKKEIWKE